MSAPSPKLTHLNAIEGWIDEADHAIQMAKFHLLEAYKESKSARSGTGASEVQPKGDHPGRVVTVSPPAETRAGTP